MNDVTLPEALVLGGYSVSPEGDPPEAGTGLRTLARTGPAAYEVVAQQVLRSPTWIEPHPSRPWLLSIGETSPSELVCTEISDDGSLRVLDRLTTGGDDGCHLAISDDGRQVVVAHYTSGTVQSFALDDEGRLTGPLASFVSSAPLGPVVDRQDGPHAHQVVFDEARDELLVCDLGTDRVHRLRLRPDGRLSEAASALVLPPGSGPRHLVVAGDVLLIACELSVELWVGRRTEDGWAQTQIVATTSRTAAERARSTAPVLPSEVRVAGDRVVVATRGVDTVSTFALDRATDTVTFAAEVSCGGHHPRDLVLDDALVWVANQWSDEVVALDLEAVAVGREQPPAIRFSTPRPACVVLDRGRRPGTTVRPWTTT